MKAWTDYPIVELGDSEGRNAPIRECTVLSYDGDKYCEVEVCGVKTQFICAYIYQGYGRLGEVPRITRRQLAMLPETTYGQPGNGEAK